MTTQIDRRPLAAAPVGQLPPDRAALADIAAYFTRLRAAHERDVTPPTHPAADPLRHDRPDPKT